jgi:hypothetical protein
MQFVPEPERSEMIRRLRERSRLDAEELMSRPPFTILGLAASVLRPASLAEYGRVNDAWSSVTLAYGDWVAPAGPHVRVTTAVAADDADDGAEAELLRAIDADRSRIAAVAGVDDEEPADPPDYTRSRLPAGDALLCSHGALWAARLSGGDATAATGVTVTITGRGVDPESVRLEPVGDLRPYFEARNEILGQLAEHRRHIPPPVLEPAEGVAALRALADSALESHDRIITAARARRAPRPPAGWGPRHAALWQRAVSEQQRVAGVDKEAADYVVTLAVNQLTHLAEEAPWFADPRLREAAIDETLRHAMLGHEVRSEAAQRLWAQYWSARTNRSRRRADPAAMLADVQDNKPVIDAWRDAWAAWAERG